MRYSLLKASAIAGLLLGLSAGAQAATVTSLTPIAPVSGSTSTNTLAINDNGVVAGGWVDSNNIEHAFYGPPDGSNYTSFDYGNPGYNGYGTEARAINNTGVITGYFSSSTLGCNTFVCAFERSSAGKISTITMSGTPITGIPGDINPTGEFVGAYFPSTGGENAYYGKNHAYTSDISLPFSTTLAAARGYNTNGEVVGFFQASGSSKISGFVLQGSTVTVINDPHPNAVNGTYLEGVSKAGWIVGVWDDKVGNLHGFMLSPDLSTFLEIAVPNSAFSETFGINSSNRVVVASANGSFIYCDSRTHPRPLCAPAAGDAVPASAPVRVPPGAFVQYKCHGDCITYKFATPGAKTAPAGTVAVRAFQQRRPGIYLP